LEKIDPSLLTTIVPFLLLKRPNTRPIARILNWQQHPKRFSRVLTMLYVDGDWNTPARCRLASDKNELAREVARLVSTDTSTDTIVCCFIRGIVVG